MKRSSVPFVPKDKAQRRALVALLEEAFGSKYTDYYLLQLDRVASPDSTHLLADESGKLIAHIQVVPYYAFIEKGTPAYKSAYLYAICTVSEAQGHGIMTQFLTETLRLLPSQGYDSALLLPASKDLVGYYQRFGFIPMEGNTYAHLPKSHRPAIRPGTEATEFITEALKLDELLTPDSSSSTITHFNPKEPQLMPTEAPWMHHPLDNPTPYPATTALLSPMT